VPVLGVAMDLAFVFALLNRLVMGGAVFFVPTLSTLLGELPPPADPVLAATADRMVAKYNMMLF
jgi:hypothetical protein